jgi:hypothetical protein
MDSPIASSAGDPNQGRCKKEKSTQKFDKGVGFPVVQGLIFPVIQVLVQREISCQYPLNFVVDGCFILEGGPFGGSCLTNFGEIHATLQAVRGGHRIAKPAFRTDFHIPSLPFEKTIALKLTRNPLDSQFYRPRAGYKPVFD